MMESLRVMLNSTGKCGRLAPECPCSHIATCGKKIPVHQHSEVNEAMQITYQVHSQEMLLGRVMVAHKEPISGEIKQGIWA